MLKNIDYSKILFFDIETVPLSYHFSDMDERGKELWDKKSKFLQERDGLTPEETYEKAGIYAEFSKVVCISMGFITQKDGEEQVRIKSIFSKDEKELLQEFINLLDSYYSSPEYMLCAHNGKEFDIPFYAEEF